MKERLLIVIDMLNDFIEPDGALPCGKAGEKIVNFVAEKAKEFTGNNESVIFVMDSHDEDDLEFNRFPPHCVKGSRGADLIRELEGLGDKSVTYKIYKSRYSGFYGTDLDQLLRELQPAEIHIVGVCTNICVLYTVEELCNRDYETIVYKKGVASFDEDAHLWALKQMENVLGAKVI